MKDSFITVISCLITLAVSTSAMRNNPYRKALTRILVNECNTNRLLIYQIDDDTNEFAEFEKTFSCSGYPDAVSIHEYLGTIYQNLQLDGIPNNDGIFVLVTLYINRLMERTSMKVTYWNVHRVLCMSLWMACKMQYDVPFNIHVSSQSIGLDVEGMNCTESFDWMINK